MYAAHGKAQAIEDADIVQAEESALKNIISFGILAVHPPGEIQQQLVKDALQKEAVACPSFSSSIW